MGVQRAEHLQSIQHGKHNSNNTFIYEYHVTKEKSENKKINERKYFKYAYIIIF